MGGVDRFRPASPALYAPDADELRGWLACSDQDALDLGKVRRLLGRMRDGRWFADRNRPVIHEHGRLFDGHHRVLAALLYGGPVEMWVEDRGR